MKLQLVWPLLLCLLAPVPLRAGPQAAGGRERARQLVKEAERAYRGKDYERALGLLEEAHRLFPSDKIQYTRGLVYQAQQRWLDARQAFADYLRNVSEEERGPERSASASEAVARLTALLGRIQVEAPAGVSFQVDQGAALAATQVAFVLPGKHEVTALGSTQTVEVRGGEVARVKLPGRILVEAPGGTTFQGDRGAAREEPAIRPIAAPLPKKRSSRWKLWTGGALALAGGGLTALGSTALAVDGSCVSPDCEAIYRGGTLGAVTLGLGLPLLVAGATLAILDLAPRRKEARPAPARRGGLAWRSGAGLGEVTHAAAR